MTIAVKKWLSFQSLVEMLKVNKNLHQMAIKLTENALWEKARKAEQEMPITPEPPADYDVGVAAAPVNAVSSGVCSSRACVARKLSTPVISRRTEWWTTRSTAASVGIVNLGTELNTVLQ